MSTATAVTAGPPRQRPDIQVQDHGSLVLLRAVSSAGRHWLDDHVRQHAYQPFPAALLPGALAPWVADVAERVQCPPDFVAVGVLVAAAAVIGRKVAIRPKRQDDWAVVPNLWGLAVGPPGSMKSPALAEALRPLRRLVSEARAQYEEQQLAHQFRLVERQARRDA